MVEQPSNCPFQPNEFQVTRSIGNGKSVKLTRESTAAVTSDTPGTCRGVPFIDQQTRRYQAKHNPKGRSSIADFCTGCNRYFQGEVVQGIITS